MDSHQPQPKFRLSRMIRKLYLSAFVVISFILYAIQRPTSNTNAIRDNLSTPLPDSQTSQSLFTATVVVPITDQATATGSIASPATATAVPPVAVVPTDTAVSTRPAASGLYKDGTYTGPEIDAVYGLVQVQTVIQNGKIANVQFLEYPSDRRTSVRINTYAVPHLQQEAIQAQNARVDLIGGATLTSEAFAMSLQSALDQAKN